MNYVDGFVTAVPNNNKEEYIRQSKLISIIFQEFGALKHVECWGDDVPEGKLTSFPMAVKKQDDETVVFSWIIWPDKATRNSGFEKVMADPRLKEITKKMTFDGKRVIYGGFDMVFESF